MAKQGFKRNAKTIGQILKTQDGGKRAAAAKILAQIDDSEAFIEEYTTDREVIGIVVPADKQAKTGLATKAASAAGIGRGNP
ncbi:MAG: hypothetical protein WD072_03420 [Pirellulales bacterium]